MGGGCRLLAGLSSGLGPHGGKFLHEGLSTTLGSIILRIGPLSASFHCTRNSIGSPQPLGASIGNRTTPAQPSSNLSLDYPSQGIYETTSLGFGFGLFLLTLRLSLLDQCMNICLCETGGWIIAALASLRLSFEGAFVVPIGSPMDSE